MSDHRPPTERLSAIPLQDNISSDDTASEFRRYYYRLHHATEDLAQSLSDTVVLARLGDQLDIYLQLLHDVRSRQISALPDKI